MYELTAQGKHTSDTPILGGLVRHDTRGHSDARYVLPEYISVNEPVFANGCSQRRARDMTLGGYCKPSYFATTPTAAHFLFVTVARQPLALSNARDSRSGTGARPLANTLRPANRTGIARRGSQGPRLHSARVRGTNSNHDALHPRSHVRTLYASRFPRRDLHCSSSRISPARRLGIRFVCPDLRPHAQVDRTTIFDPDALPAYHTTTGSPARTSADGCAWTAPVLLQMQRASSPL